MLIVLLAVLFFGVQAFAAVSGLPNVPGPGGSNINPNDINSIPGLISYIYNLAFWIVGIAVFFQVFRGGFVIFFGAAGSASKISEGKKIITNAIIGLVLLFASWMILNVINPDLVKNTFDFGTLLQGENNNDTNSLPGVSSGAGGGTPTPNPRRTPRPGKGADCTPLTSGVCTPDGLKNYGNWDPKTASIVCRGESGGNPDTPPATGDACYITKGGKQYPVSFGLFQILVYGTSANPQFQSVCSNVLVYEGSKNCFAPMKKTKGGQAYCPERKCHFGPKGESGYNTCVAAVKKADPNIKQAVNLYHTPLGWTNWSAYNNCKNTGKI